MYFCSKVKSNVNFYHHITIFGSKQHTGFKEGYLSTIQQTCFRMCLRDPHQLYLRLESLLQEFVVEMKVRLLEQLQNSSKIHSLAQDFLTGNYWFTTYS